jgi:hypothetical protein
MTDGLPPPRRSCAGQLRDDRIRDDQRAFDCLVDFLAGGEPMELEETTAVPVPEKPPGDFAEELRARFLRYIGGDNAA